MRGEQGMLPQISADEAIELSGVHAWLLDVRESHEWLAGHAPVAHSIPMSVIQQRWAEIPTGERILVICHSGVRSAQVTAALLSAGHDAVDVAGGMVAWQLAGGDIVDHPGGVSRA